MNLKKQWLAVKTSVGKAQGVGEWGGEHSCHPTAESEGSTTAIPVQATLKQFIHGDFIWTLFMSVSQEFQERKDEYRRKETKKMKPACDG